jgi:DNA-binding NarL/FixJ family response regulator
VEELQEPEPVRVFVLDDQPMFRDAVRRFFDGETGVVAVGGSGTREDFYPALVNARPDVILVDPSARFHHLGDLVAELRKHCPGVGVIILSMAYDHDRWTLALAAGADAFVSKERSAEELKDTVIRVAAQAGAGPRTATFISRS